MPTVPEIKISIENNLIKDAFFKNAQFLKDSRDRLLTYTGGFSVVFPAIVNGKKWAFRCWHADLGNVRNRYERLSKAIKEAKLSYLCDFAYTDEGIIVEGKIYPTTRMRWVEGTTIKEYICNNKSEKEKLKSLAENFLNMCKDMHMHKFAHGDLQHGNIIVDTDDKIFLVDYDSFYCPELQGESDIISGLKDYQHPARALNKIVSKKLDYFSELIIYLSILAIAENPNFVVQYQVDAADRMLFTSDDYKDLSSSKIYQELKALKNKNITQLLEILETYLEKPSIGELEPFDVLWDNMNDKFVLESTKIKRHQQKAFLSWDIKSFKEISLYEGNNKILQCEAKGSIEVHPDNTTIYRLEIVSSSGSIKNKEQTLYVFDVASILFESDKMYVLPQVPFTLRWEVKNAKSVCLDGESVDYVGSKFIDTGIEQETSYILKVTDEFEEQTKHLIVRMLPMPIIKQIQAPFPAINTQVYINVNEHILDEHLIELIKQKSIEKASFVEDLSKLNLEIETPSFIPPKFKMSETFVESFKVSCNELRSNMMQNFKEVRESLISIIKETINNYKK